jgi:hypothetical protein
MIGLSWIPSLKLLRNGYRPAGAPVFRPAGRAISMKFGSLSSELKRAALTRPAKERRISGQVYMTMRKPDFDKDYRASAFHARSAELD